MKMRMVFSVIAATGVLASAITLPANAQSAEPTPNSVARAAAGGLPPGLAAICNAPCDPYPNMKKLLVIADVQTGYHHASINHTMAVIEQIGRKSGVFVSFLRTDSQLITKGPITVSSARYARGNTNIRNLNYFDAVMFLGSGEGTLTDQQKADLVSFVRDDGKGLILGHAQGVNFYNWPQWGEMIGGFMASEYPLTGMTAKVVDHNWKSASALGKKPFLWRDQWPVLKPEFKRGDVHTIVELDPSKFTPEQASRGRSDGYYPIVWAKSYGKGRVFNMTGGHNDQTLDDPKTQALLLEGVKWTMGLVQHNVTPDQ